MVKVAKEWDQTKVFRAKVCASLRQLFLIFKHFNVFTQVIFQLINLDQPNSIVMPPPRHKPRGDQHSIASSFISDIKLSIAKEGLLGFFISVLTDVRWTVAVGTLVCLIEIILNFAVINVVKCK